MEEAGAAPAVAVNVNHQFARPPVPAVECCCRAQGCRESKHGQIGRHTHSRLQVSTQTPQTCTWRQHAAQW